MSLFRKVTFENFKPRLREGRVIPQGSRIIFETNEPYDQIILPIELADVLLLCSGQFSIREIIEKVYHKQEVVHFKAIFKVIYTLRDRGFFVNGDELETQVGRLGFDMSESDFQIPFSIKLTLGRRLLNNRAKPVLFYLISMLLICLGLTAVISLDVQSAFSYFMKIDNSYATGFILFIVCNSIIISFTNSIRGLLILLLTGRLYNLRVNISPLGLHLVIGEETLSLIQNKLFQILYHLAVLSSPLFVFFISFQLLPARYLPHLSLLCLGHTMWLFSPFLKSPVLKLISFLSGQTSEINLDGNIELKTSVNSKFDNMQVYWVLVSIWSFIFVLLSVRFWTENSLNLISGIKASDTKESLAGLYFFLTYFLITSRAITQMSFSYIQKWLEPMFKKIVLHIKTSSIFEAVPWERAKILQSIQELPLFSYFSDELINEVLDQSQVLSYAPGSRILSEGESATDLFVLLEGRIHVEKRELKGRRRLAVMRAVTIFGEMSIIGEDVRKADLNAATRAACLKIPSESIRKAAQKSQYVREIDAFKNAIMVNQFFSSAPLFRDLPQDAINVIMMKSRIEFVPANKVIFYEGQKGDSFYMVIRGSVDVSIQDLVIKRINQYGFFGEIALIADIPRTATITTAEPSVLLSIQADAFWEMLVQNIETAILIESVSEMRIKEDLHLMEGGLLKRDSA